MLNISFNVEMPDLNRHEIEIQCPICKLHNWVKLGEIRRGDFLVCRGCHANVHLEDHLGAVQRFIKQFENFEQIFKGG